MSQTKNILKRMMHLSLLASMGFAAVLYGASPALAQISLGTAESFGVLGGSAVTNTGASVITGNLGVSPGTAVTGFPPGIVVAPSTIHSADAVAAQAQIDLTTAYVAITNTPTLVDLTGTDLGGLTLGPGVYGFSSSAQLTGTLTLNAGGNPNAVFIFKIGSTLTTASGSFVSVINGGSNCNVFWQVGSSATLGTTTTFAGNILALTSITLTTGANVSGRALARNGAVTLDGNSVTVCPPIVVPPLCPIITLDPTALPSGVVGTAYSQTRAASGSTALPYTYAVSIGALPGGLSLDTTAGAITGTPNTVGTFIFTITATDTNLCSGSQLYSIVIAAAAIPPCPPITLSPLALPSGPLGAAYSQTVSASGGTAPYTYSVSGTLPTGLSLNPGTGAITGTPTVAGIFPFTITATDKNGCTGLLGYTVTITPCPVITLSPATLPSGPFGAAYSQTVSASGGTAPYTYSVSGTLPTGLSLNPGTGAITGTPTTAGVFAFIITATDANGCTGLLGYTVTIANCPVITLSPTTLPADVVGTPYSQTVSASGGTAPYWYVVSSGALPTGLSLNPGTGAITGTPTTAGVFSFIITATDANGCTGLLGYTVTMVIAEAAAVAVPTLSEWGIIIFMVFLGLMSIYYLRRQKVKV